MDQHIQEFLTKKRIVIFGVSHSDQKFGNATYKELKQRGYDVVAVHPTLEMIDGDPCYKNLHEVTPQADAAFINVAPTSVPPILTEIAKTNIKSVWLQQGSESEDAVKLGKELGLSVVKGGCILMYAEPVSSFHAFHRWLWKLIKKY